MMWNSPRAVTPGSTTKTVVLAIILLSSSSEPEEPCWVARDRPDSESGSVTQRDSPHSSRSQRRMSHWTWTVLESGNRNIEYSLDVEIPRSESNTNWDRTFLSGHLHGRIVIMTELLSLFLLPFIVEKSDGAVLITECKAVSDFDAVFFCNKRSGLNVFLWPNLKPRQKLEIKVVPEVVT